MTLRNWWIETRATSIGVDGNGKERTVNVGPTGTRGMVDVDVYAKVNGESRKVLSVTGRGTPATGLRLYVWDANGKQLTTIELPAESGK